MVRKYRLRRCPGVKLAGAAASVMSTRDLLALGICSGLADIRLNGCLRSGVRGPGSGAWVRLPAGPGPDPERQSSGASGSARSRRWRIVHMPPTGWPRSGCRFQDGRSGDPRRVPVEGSGHCGAEACAVGPARGPARAHHARARLCSGAAVGGKGTVSSRGASFTGASAGGERVHFHEGRSRDPGRVPVEGSGRCGAEACAVGPARGPTRAHHARAWLCSGGGGRGQRRRLPAGDVIHRCERRR